MAPTSTGDDVAKQHLLPPPPATFPHSLPPPVLRLLSLSSPWVNVLHSFIHLATWTQPEGGGTHSVLLLLGWTFLCLFAYPVLRYAPQLLVLGLVLGTAVPNVLLRRQGARGPNASAVAQATLTQKQTDELLQKLSDILDVTSTLHARIVLPVWQALTWQHPQGHAITIGAAIMATTLGTVWTLCFADWPAAWSKMVVLVPFGPAWSYFKSSTTTAGRLAKLHLYDAYLKASIEAKLASWPILADFQRHVIRANAWLLPRLPTPASTALALPYLPPFPLFSLNLSNAVLAIGLVAFSWCSTYATLVRHALWKSATIRRVTRGAVRLTSFGYLGGPSAAGFYRVGGSQLSAATLAANSRSEKAKSTSSSSASDSPRVNTVPYRFELYENQRWWMGLDWTAALLPQERASWTDSALSPVSPPASFTLPNESVTWRPKPTKEKPNAWEKRVIRWRWEEEEWRVVVNVGGGLGTGKGETPSAAGRRASESGATAGSPSTPTRRGSGTSNGGSTLFSSFTSRNTPSSVIEETEDEDNAAPQTPGDSSAVSEDTSLPTDASGWRYGDNGWEKMTNKVGLGKYTRRRKWVRRARMEEIVFSGVEKPQEGPADGEKEESRKIEASPKPVNGGLSTAPSSTRPLSESTVAGEAASSDDPAASAAKNTQVDADAPASPPSSPLPAGGSRGDLKSRLASAAGGNGGT